ncbi:uncharacterized protein LOC121244170 [Juglans microcarpa x Juglans regia]|uniref:uncharacterized protein LOC121244170 n=1 Tax=Juglans microcarpa x Juglans regia TaxID=2249226 RepID=UPI001B7ED8EE|nr:uncharacterized protein LOC121244170 [Juglans microcarpa x Juglans regia]
MGKVQKNPMRSDTEAFPLCRRALILGLTEYVVVASFIEFLHSPFLRSTILWETDDFLIRPPFIQSERWYAILLLFIIFTTGYILRYLYWLTLSVGYSILPEQRKDMIMRWDLWYWKRSYSQPDFLKMVPWYSGTSADLYKTIYDLMVSVNIFQGRFDLRILQAALNHAQNGADQQENLLHDFSGNAEELWFDFMADTGDGGDSTYTVARLLAEPHICFASCILKRGDLLLIGGDLAYPNPSKSTYEQRLLRPFEYALDQPPVNYEEADHHDRPQCFVIPGNHDWFDGLRTFTKYICEKRCLGGWFMPQKTTYFALKLPQRWWIFGCDLALDGDLDTYQFQFFLRIAREMIGDNDCVIVMTHQPDWLLDWYEGGTDHVDRENLSNLICQTLKERCKLRIAGDIHHYMHHSMAESNDSIYAQHLLVNGCGGAFAHPTHVFGDFKESHGVSYGCEASYPDRETSRKLGFKNIRKFKKENWQFDYVGGIMYYMLAFSVFPQCELHHIFEVDSKSSFLRICFHTLWNAFIYMLEHSYVSLGAVMLLLIVAFALAPSKVSRKKRVVMAILHVSAHLVAALILMLALELGLELLTRHKLSATTSDTFIWINIRYQFIAVTRSNICKNGMASLSRFETIRYYGSVFFYFWPLSTFVVSYMLGFYLCICVSMFNLHYDEAFSSLRIADYKGFTRFHIKPNGDLEVFTLAVDKVPWAWREDPDWQREKKIDPERSSHKRWFPSKWMADSSCKDPLESVKIIEQFVIGRENRPAK